MLVVCPSHVFKGKPHPNRSVNFFKGDGRKKIEASGTLRTGGGGGGRGGGGGFGRGNSSRSSICEGLTLSLPVPEVISVQPSKAPDHGHDQASDHTVVKSLCVSFPLSHFTGGLVQSLNMLSERISMVPLPPSWVPIISDGSQSFSISKLIEQRNHATVIAMCLVIISDMQWSVHTTHSTAKPLSGDGLQRCPVTFDQDGLPRKFHGNV